MDNTQMQYMVDFTMPKELSEEFVSLIPRQRAVVSSLMSEGKLLNYALSLENGKLWAVFCGRSENEVMDMVQSLPLAGYMRFRISELTFFNTAQAYSPVFSVN